MRTLFLQLITATFLFSLLAQGAIARRYYNYPTKWFLRSNVEETIFLQCEGSTTGLRNKIKFYDNFIESKTASWDGWHNDGVGLNWANWDCAISFNPNPLTIPGIQHHQFKTGWGENIFLTILRKSDGRFHLTKSTAN